MKNLFYFFIILCFSTFAWAQSNTQLEMKTFALDFGFSVGYTIKESCMKHYAGSAQTECLEGAAEGLKIKDLNTLESSIGFGPRAIGLMAGGGARMIACSKKNFSKVESLAPDSKPIQQESEWCAQALPSGLKASEEPIQERIFIQNYLKKRGVPMRMTNGTPTFSMDMPH